jgi:hypothetical protein
VDIRGGPNGGGGDGRATPDREVQRPGRARASGRGAGGADDPLRMAVPRGSGGSDLIGLETGTSESGELEAPGSYRSWSPVEAPATGPERCPYLKTIASDGRLFDAGRDAVPTHRCSAFGDPLPLSIRQQELVCLQRVYTSCPRYMRGQLLAEELAAADVPRRQSHSSNLMLAGVALVLLAGLGAVAALMGFMPGLGPAAPTATASSIAEATATATATDTLEPTPVVTASPSARITPTPALTPTLAPTWPPGASASRMALLSPCPDEPNCWIYTVRSAAQNGSTVDDTVKGIATWFGVSVDTIYEMNPWATAGIQPGDKLKIPPPTK